MNYFDQMADRQLNGTQKAKERRDVKTAERRAEKARAPSPMELKQVEASILMKMYRAWRREVKAEILQRHGRDFAELMRRLRNIHWREADALVEFVDEAAWLRDADADTRFHTLSYIDEALIRARIKYGLPPFDDGIPDMAGDGIGEEPGPGAKIRMILCIDKGA